VLRRAAICRWTVPCPDPRPVGRVGATIFSVCGVSRPRSCRGSRQADARLSNAARHDQRRAQKTPPPSPTSHSMTSRARLSRAPVPNDWPDAQRAEQEPVPAGAEPEATARNERDRPHNARSGRGTKPRSRIRRTTGGVRRSGRRRAGRIRSFREAVASNSRKVATARQDGVDEERARVEGEVGRRSEMGNQNSGNRGIHCGEQY